MNRTLYSKLIFDHSHPGRRGYSLPDRACEGALQSLPATLMRATAPELPEVDEPTVVRHYTNQSTNNFGVDTGF